MPNKPAPQEVTVDPKTTAFLVLDLNCRCEDPQEATAAVRPFGYTCVIPIDGLVARGAYEHDLTAPIHHPPGRRRGEVSDHRVRQDKASLNQNLI